MSPIVTILLALCLAAPLRGDVILQGFYWDVPSPAAGNAAAPWWWDRLASEAQNLARAGFTAVWIPPVTKGASGGYSVGYDPFDDYDIGSKLQRGSLPTRYGTREQLERCVAVLRANGFDVYVDLVENHRCGDDGQFHFAYADAYGHTPGGRFPKGPMDFHPNVPQDPNVPDGPVEPAQFGRDVAHVNGEGGRIGRGLMASADWLYRALGIQGCRLDYVKGISTDWLRPFLEYGALKSRFAVAEFWDGDLGKVRSWVTGSMAGRCSAFDFPLRYVLKEMCDSTGGFDMRRLDHAGLAGVDPAHAVTFAENHDTDRSDPIVNRKALAYAYILTSEGTPCVFYRDYSTAPGCYGMKPVLDKLLWVRSRLAQGSTVVREKTPDVFAFERTGGPGLVVAMTDDTASGHTTTVQTGFGAGQRLHDYAGNGADVVTDETGGATLTVPSNATGSGFVCYSRAGIGEPVQTRTFSVTQEYEGARDLDIPPAPVVSSAPVPGAVTSSSPLAVCRLRVAGGSTLQSWLRVDTSRWTARTTVALDLRDGSGVRLGGLVYRASTRPDALMRVRVPRTGDYVFSIGGRGTPAASPNPSYRLRVTYTAPQTLDLPRRIEPMAREQTAGGWVKYAGNPVLGGRYGTCFDVSVLRDGGRYRMWMSWRPKKSIALVESVDGIHWSEPAIVLPPRPETGWEDDINRPSVVKRADGYHMWYTGQAKGHSSLGYATSADGRVWQRRSDRPVLSVESAWEKVAVMCPSVLWDERAKLWRMWYSGGDQYEPDAIGAATSPDGVTWTRSPGNPVFTPDTSGSGWDRHKVTGCQVIPDARGYVMFYIGFRDVDHAQIGLARSPDGLTGWERHPANPIIRPGESAWDHDACYRPFALFDGRKWLLWYNGRHGGLEQIGLATHTGRGLF